MKTGTEKISITIGSQNLEDVEVRASKEGRSRSKMIDIAVGEYLDNHEPKRKIKKVLAKRNGKN